MLAVIQDFSENDSMTACLIYSTWPDGDQAGACARTLIEQRLAACVTILPGARSIYRWDGVIHDDRELVMLAKSDANHAQDVRDAILAAHPYDVPCVLMLPIDPSGSNPEFLLWAVRETSR